MHGTSPTNSLLAALLASPDTPWCVDASTDADGCPLSSMVRRTSSTSTCDTSDFVQIASKPDIAGSVASAGNPEAKWRPTPIDVPERQVVAKEPLAPIRRKRVWK
mmetsp:Transcript_37774/g.90731  ORF Transcript_37774/g.90731 Transcript_37774/m.90731 type:complete len:105 (+) Transcript_37774:34-348(+)